MVKSVAPRMLVHLMFLAAVLAACNSGNPTARLPDSGEPEPEPAPDSGERRSEVSPDLAPTVPDAASIDASSLDSASPPDLPSQRCNGHAALCDRRLDQVVFPATHNAMSNSDDSWLAPNQTHGIERQLADGVRALLVDTHAWRGGVHLCHGICEIGNRPLLAALRGIAGFLRAHPDEVLVMIIEDGAGAAETEAVFVESGLASLVYTYKGGPWPTLRQMIAEGRRVVVTAERGRPPPAWYHHAWDLIWDTPYSFKNPGDFSCQLNRGSRDHALFLLNHWLENPLPTQGQSATANAREALLSRARKCQAESGKLPNFVAVNHYGVGALFEVVRELNGL
jgi:hypothetical protein